MFAVLVVALALACAAPADPVRAEPAAGVPAAQLPPEAKDDPTLRHRWHLPLRGEHRLAPEAVGPVHAEWNQLGQLVHRGKVPLKEWGVTFDAALDFFDQYASEVDSGKQNLGSFSWFVMGDWRLFDLESHEVMGPLGKGFLSWNVFGTSGLNYDASEQTLSGNAGAVSVLNGTVFSNGAVVDEFYWKQVAWGGKLVLLGGKIDMICHFDTNRIANDAYSEFFSDALQNNPSIPAPIYGGFGGVVRANLPRDFYVMLGTGDSSMDTAALPWKTLDNHSWYQLLEFGGGLLPQRLGKGTWRLTPWHNHLFGEDGFGFAFNLDQELGSTGLVVFFRFGWGDEDVTPFETFVSGGFGLEAPFGREQDLAAIGAAWSNPSPASGSRNETILELFYRVELASAITLTPDLQLVFDPTGNPDADLVVVPGVRLQLAF